VRWAEAGDLPAALGCYERNGYGGAILPADRVLVAERDGRIVGVVRLVDEEGHRVLRGMYLDAPERGRGLGRRMLRALAERIGPRACWLVCGTGLAGFYGREGFHAAAGPDVPEHLRARAERYAREHGPQLVLRRAPEEDPAPPRSPGT
jgi:GNAT superfamily N-acetyltransferase